MLHNQLFTALQTLSTSHVGALILVSYITQHDQMSVTAPVCVCVLVPVFGQRSSPAFGLSAPLDNNSFTLPDL